jgi:hypothetical protein
VLLCVLAARGSAATPPDDGELVFPSGDGKADNYWSQVQMFGNLDYVRTVGVNYEDPLARLLARNPLVIGRGTGVQGLDLEESGDQRLLRHRSGPSRDDLDFEARGRPGSGRCFATSLSASSRSMRSGDQPTGTHSAISACRRMFLVEKRRNDIAVSPDAAAIFGWARACTSHTPWSGRFGCDLLDDDLVAPVIAEVVDIVEPVSFTDEPFERVLFL